MSSVSAGRIAELLLERFATTPVLTWWDVMEDHADELEAIAAAVGTQGIDLIVHRVSGDEFAVKYRLYALVDGEHPGAARQLVYRTGERPQARDNWLLDVEVGYGIFTADTASVLVHDLGLDHRGIANLIAEHLRVFDTANRTESVRELLTSLALPADTPPDKFADTLRGIMSAAVLGLHGPGSHRLYRITEALLEDYAEDRTDRYDALESYGLADFFWQGCQRIYGYLATAPTVAGLVTWLFDQAWRGWPATDRPAARIDFERLRADRAQRRLFTELAERAQDDLNIVEQLRANPFRLEELIDRDVFPVVDRTVIRLLSAAVLEQTVPPERVAAIVRQRSATTWFDDPENSYRALAAASDCLARVDAFAPIIADPADGVRSYADNWCAIDRTYRTFRHHLALTETDLPDELGERAERRYVEGYQRPLAEAWQKQVDALDSWSVPGIAPLGQFAREDLPAKAKTLVIISDALRYEVGAELAEKMDGDDWFSSTIEPRLAPLPSFTQLGMASHLPHKRLTLTDDATVRADGNLTTDLKTRAALWNTVDAAALDYNKVIAMRADELATLWSEHSALVVYHDVIDTTGETYVSERSTPEACTRAINEIANLVRKFGRGKTRASRVLITADHGFLFQNSELGPSDYLSESAHGEEVIVRNRRFVLGRGLRDHPAFTLWSSEQLGLDGDLQVQIPRALHRLRRPGAGVRFVHGGASLQEVVVPLVTLTQSRRRDTSKVEVDLNTSSPSVTSSTVIVTLTQREPVNGKRRGRTLSIGVWAIDGTLLSNERIIQMDNPSDDIRDRQTSIELVLGEEAERYNEQTVQIRADEIAHGTRTTYKSTSVTLQRGFGGFFDPL
jgi:uncharacterized protein (TIGR02687 family)